MTLPSTRTVCVLACLSLGACAVEDAPEEAQAAQAASLAFTRTRVAGDIYHYELVLPVGPGPNAAIRVHRVVRELAPFVPRRARKAVALLHGDFSTFVTNFVPSLAAPADHLADGLAPYLAARGIDVWGFDRRWTLPGADDDISDFADMGLAQAVADTRTGLAFARGIRAASGAGTGTFAVVGFSHGAQVAYALAGYEGGLPAAQRHVGAIAPLDWWGGYTAAHEEDRQLACAFAEQEYQLVADGEIDSPNRFFIRIGDLARSAPDAQTPFVGLFGPVTNRAAMLLVVGQTYQIAPFTPWYHLLAPQLDGDTAIGLTETTEQAAAAWLAGATPHQSMREAADFDAMLCGEQLPLPAPMANIRIPIFYVGAAGAVGQLGLESTALTHSTDIQSLIVQRQPAGEQLADFGHGDLLFAADAPTLVWHHLASWIGQH